MVQGICESLGRDEVAALRAGLVERTRAVAKASGGLLGVGSVSSAEAGDHQAAGVGFPLVLSARPVGGRSSGAKGYQAAAIARRAGPHALPTVAGAAAVRECPSGPFTR